MSTRIRNLDDVLMKMNIEQTFNSYNKETKKISYCTKKREREMLSQNKINSDPYKN